MANPTPQNLYGYKANEVLPIITALVIAASTIWHALQNQKYNFWRVTFFMVGAGSLYALGWIVRIASVRDPDSLPLYMVQSILIYLSPPVYSAAEYNILGRLMHYLPMHSIINPNRVVYIFVFFGTLVEGLTALGAASMATGSSQKDESEYNLGATLMAISVILQAVVELGFIAITGNLHHRRMRSKMLPKNVRILFVMLYGTSTLIIIRSIFRAVETFQLRGMMSNANQDAALLKHEWPFYVLETIPVALYTFWLNIVHPGRYLPSNPKQYLDYDGKTERMGPGWVYRRHWVMFIIDPLNFIGMLTMPKREKYYLQAERWAEVENCFAQSCGDNRKQGWRRSYWKVGSSESNGRRN
ncbi:hypothetical protein FDECE_104 [Fusarium decemcellulare]|nr:hypothetical protein FDECE_104 [Fusarium decemcellulare]